MPFTLSHAAAALPFRRSRLVPSALLIGTFAPDLEYFIRLRPGGGWGHTLPGAFGMSLPLGLAALWIFHRFVKVPLVYLLPETVRARLSDQLLPFRFVPLTRFLNIVLSLLIGIATHLLWDSCTHSQYWIASHVQLLQYPLHLPVIGWEPLSDTLQLVTSAAGLAVLALWCLFWYRRSLPDDRIPGNPFSPSQKTMIVLLGIAAATLGSVLRAYIGVGVPRNYHEKGDFLDQMVVTFGALAWWQLAMWGFIGPFRRLHGITAEEETYAQSRASLERQQP